VLAGRVDNVAVGDDCADFAEDSQNFSLVHAFASFFFLVLCLAIILTRLHSIKTYIIFSVK
jgi:hypothetical protein